MQTTHPLPCPCFSSSETRRSKLHAPLLKPTIPAFSHHGQIISSDNNNHISPHSPFDACFHASLKRLGSPVSRNSSSASSFFSLPSASAWRSLKSSAPFSSPSSQVLSSSFSAVKSLKSTAFGSSSTSSCLSSSSSPPSAASVNVMRALLNNPLSSSSSFPCNHITLHVRTEGISSKGPVSNGPCPTSSSFSHKQNLSFSMSQKGKCNCSLFSQAKDFIAGKLGLSDDGDDEEELSQGSPQSAIKLPKEREGSQANMGNLAQRWREIQGLNHWEGLLDPLDLELRRTLLFYGDFNQAVYDSFETDQHSKYTGACRFAKENFFQGVRLVKGRGVQYNVVRYLYAASSSIDTHGLVFMKSYSREAWSKESNWIGYVAVSDDEASKVLGRRDIVIVWRGTMRPFEWLDDFDFRKADVTPLVPASSSQQKRGDDDGGDEPSIEQGWLTIYTNTDSKSAFTASSARDQVLNEVRSQFEKYKDEDVSITIMGHSLGAALAVVNAFDIAVNKINVREGKETALVTAFVYGCPGVGDEAFAKKCEKLEGLRVLRVKNKIDLITKYPGWLMGYRDVGEELLFSSLDSPYLKDSVAPGDWHNLEVHLHMVAGTQGVGKSFKFTVNRDVALINKSSEALRDDFLIPASWWQMQFKGLVQREDGFWYMPDREEGDRPKPEPLNDLMSQSQEATSSGLSQG